MSKVLANRAPVVVIEMMIHARIDNNILLVVLVSSLLFIFLNYTTMSVCMMMMLSRKSKMNEGV
jgi:hypothetical protein